jgi:hypothetical protein
MPAPIDDDSIPEPVVYLRNNFVIKPGHNADLLKGKRELLANTRDSWTLIAAHAERPMILGQHPSLPKLQMTQVWRLEHWETLYKTIFRLSETSWYRELGDSLVSEYQELLVGISSRYSERQRTPWPTATNPGHSYVYEEALPRLRFAHSYLRDLNWFNSIVAQRGWRPIWLASQVTAGPSVICSLWEIPEDAENIEDTIRKIEMDGNTASRYAQMVGALQSLSRRQRYPIFTERLDQDMRNPPPASALGSAVSPVATTLPV